MLANICFFFNFSGTLLNFKRSVIALCFVATMGNLAIISRDRYLAVSKPWWYRSHVTRSRVFKQASVVWIFSAVLAILKYHGLQLFRVLIFPFYFICICGIISSYIGIFIANRRQRVAVQQHGNQMLANLRREQKLAKTVGLILLVLCFSFIPALISPLISAALGFSQVKFDPFKPFLYIFVTLNGLLNPLLNYGRNSGVRRAVRQLIRKN